MKRTKSIVALVLAVVLAFALSVSAFATDPVSVSIRWSGTEVYSASVYIQDIDNYKAQLRADYLSSISSPDSPHYGEPDDGRFTYHLYTIATSGTPSYPTSYTAMDALMAGWAKDNIARGVYANAPTALSSNIVDYSWYPIGSAIGAYISRFAGVPSDVGNYYYVGCKEVDGQTVYTYYWAGTSWELSIDGVVAGAYASEYELSNVSSIVIDYKYMNSGNFDTTTYIPGALPAP